MFFKKKKKKKAPPERFISLTANGEPIEALNFSLQKDKEGKPVLRLITKDVCEKVHYDEVDFVMKTDKKQLNVSGKFREAASEKRFKIYTFDITDFNQYFI